MKFTNAQLSQMIELDGRVEFGHFNPFTRAVDGEAISCVLNIKFLNIWTSSYHLAHTTCGNINNEKE